MESHFLKVYTMLILLKGSKTVSKSKEPFKIYSRDHLNFSPVVVYLIINKIQQMPKMAIESCLRQSNSKIVIGYLKESDLFDIPRDPRISVLQLEELEYLKFAVVSQEYFSFDTADFFTLVAYKWLLFKKLFELGEKHLIYSDLDVIWFSNVSKSLSETHNEISNCKVLVQSATTVASSPRLCMGLASFINSKEVLDLINECFALHLKAIIAGLKLGDDDIISDFYKNNNYPEWIRELPQVTFPVGMLINAYSYKTVFPGLYASKPQIFHANYTIGERNKILLLRIAQNINYRRLTARSLGFYWYFYWIAKRSKRRLVETFSIFFKLVGR